jgi:hypothetical protein
MKKLTPFQRLAHYDISAHGGVVIRASQTVWTTEDEALIFTDNTIRALVEKRAMTYAEKAGPKHRRKAMKARVL